MLWCLQNTDDASREMGRRNNVSEPDWGGSKDQISNVGGNIRGNDVIILCFLLSKQGFDLLEPHIRV